ncbi:3' terminal RNA ribose 2'-O-methyltransferase Hen1 [Spirochaetia bacterium]|nr:3' terminal RNA ribose 2'-O-methyltransferase Hen1 [Spirochaetia bacterium]
MLLTITYRGADAPDLGYLLHKNPEWPQTLDINFGKAHVFYPEVQQHCCTAALLLDIDPLDLTRGKEGSKGGGSKNLGLFDYVNDRPYVCSSFMSTAISKVYGTAMSGRCEKRQALADTALDLCTKLTMLPCRGDSSWLERVFGPLGYRTEFTTETLDEAYPEWGQSRYVNLSLRGTVRLRDLLRHLYVLIPVFDSRKHYWIGDAEVDKLISHGEGWLENHPDKEFITRRYFNKLTRYTRLALDRLDNGEGGAEETTEEPVVAEFFSISIPEFATDAAEPFVPLNTRRLTAVLSALKESGAQSVIDLGCGEGNLLQLLLKEKSFLKIAGTDVSASVLERTTEKLKIDRLSETQKSRLTLFQSSITYRDKRFAGYDAAAAVEVIEHLDENRLGAFAAVIFGEAAPRTIVITTVNREYNQNYPGLVNGRFRHGDHRFEWTREEFRAWAEKTAARYGYDLRLEEIGDRDEQFGAPTQMGVFIKCS